MPAPTDVLVLFNPGPTTRWASQKPSVLLLSARRGSTPPWGNRTGSYGKRKQVRAVLYSGMLIVAADPHRPHALRRTRSSVVQQGGHGRIAHTEGEGGGSNLVSYRHLPVWGNGNRQGFPLEMRSPSHRLQVLASSSPILRYVARQHHSPTLALPNS